MVLRQLLRGDSGFWRSNERRSGWWAALVLSFVFRVRGIPRSQCTTDVRGPASSVEDELGFQRNRNVGSPPPIRARVCIATAIILPFRTRSFRTDPFTRPVVHNTTLTPFLGPKNTPHTIYPHKPPHCELWQMKKGGAPQDKQFTDPFLASQATFVCARTNMARTKRLPGAAPERRAQSPEPPPRSRLPVADEVELVRLCGQKTRRG